MAQESGNDLLLLKGDGGGPETFTVVAGLQSTSISLNNEQVDITDKCSAPWRTQLGKGLRSVDISADGIASTDCAGVANTEQENILKDLISGVLANYRIESAFGYSFEGTFNVDTYEITGDVNGAETFSVSLSSSGEIVYTDIP